MTKRNQIWAKKEILNELYNTKRMTIDKIAAYLADEYGVTVTPMTVFNKLKAFGLLRNSRNLGVRSVGPPDKVRERNKRPDGGRKGFYG